MSTNNLLDTRIGDIKTALLTPNVPVTPLAGGAHALATQLNYGITPILSPVSNFDSVQLPPAIVPSGSSCAYVRLVAIGTNPAGGASNATIVYAEYGTSDTINGVANANSFNMGSTYATIVEFFCFTNGDWLTNINAS